MSTTRKTFTTTLLVAGLLALGTTAGCTTKGSGTEKTEEREASGFTGVDVSGLFKVNAKIGDEHHVEIIADDNIVPLIKTEVRDGQLTITTEGGIRPDIDPTINITAPELRMIQVSGVAKVTAAGLHGDDFTLNLSGAGKATLEGEIDNLDIQLSGAGKIDAASLKAAKAVVNVSGAGKADVYVTDTLDANISGAGKIVYSGQPTVKQNVSGAGKIEPKG